MEHKNLCTDVKWQPEHDNGICLWSETADGRPKVPRGAPRPLAPQTMKSFDEVKKGINSFIGHWSEMANNDLSRKFRRKNEPVKKYWEGVRVTFNEPSVVCEALLAGFWPTSRIANEEEDQMEDDGTLREEYAEDLPFVGHRRDRPPPSFRVGRDVYAGYFIVVRPVDDDSKPFWLARALTNPNPDPGHINLIQMQYWTLSSTQHIDMDTYAGWDTRKGNVWREDRSFPPSWSHTDYIMTAWKLRFREGTIDPRVTIPKAQMSIIKALVVAIMSSSNNDASLVEAEE